MRRAIILFTAAFLVPNIAYAKSYKSNFFYPNGEGPFPVIVLSHGRGGPSIAYHKKAEGMARNGRAAVVLDHYSARGEYGAKFQKFPKVAEGKNWREADILDFLKTLKDNPKINSSKVVLAGWSAGAGIVLPFISHPEQMELPEGVSVVGAMLTYPYTYGCYEKFESFNVPVIIHYGKLDGNDENPLSGYYCWKNKIQEFNNNKFLVVFKEYDATYHGYDLPFLKNRPKRCRLTKYRDGTGESCMEFNEAAFRRAIVANKKFLKQILDQ